VSCTGMQVVRVSSLYYTTDFDEHSECSRIRMLKTLTNRVCSLIAYCIVVLCCAAWYRRGLFYQDCRCRSGRHAPVTFPGEHTVKRIGAIVNVFIGLKLYKFAVLQVQVRTRKSS
jgi:hypothetical protein